MSMKKWIRGLAARRGYVVFNTRSESGYARDGLFTSHNDSFRHGAFFQAAYSRGVQAGSGFDPRMEWRVHVALWAAEQCARVAGDFVECGVNAGFVSSAIMHSLRWDRLDKVFHLIDTFYGPLLGQFSEEENKPRKAVEDAIARGAYVTDMRRVRANYAEWPRVQVIQGVVPDVLASLNITRVAFLHIDMNCAYPERAALEHFWDLLSPGAMVLFDDYAYDGNDYARGLLDSASMGLGARILSLPTGQGLVVK